MRLLWLLPKAAPALLRHIAGYVELAACDLKRTQREIAAKIVAFVIVGVSLIFILLLGCLAVVALTWDTPYRLSAIAWMAGGFVALAIIAMIYLANVVRDRVPFLASARHEWQSDRVILERILSDED
jgi:uncharacterized membrane protein YqjE